MRSTRAAGIAAAIDAIATSAMTTVVIVAGSVAVCRMVEELLRA